MKLRKQTSKPLGIGKNSDSSEYLSEEDFTLEFGAYSKEKFAKVNEEYRSGQKLINIHATGMCFAAAVKVVEEINRDLYEIVCSGRLMSYRMVRKFVVDYLQLDDFANLLYAAFKAPLDDIFYQPRDSDDWKLLDAHTKLYEIENQDKYQWQLRFLMNSLVATGSASFKMMEQESLVAKGWSGLTHGAYYRVMKEEGSTQFRFWIAENRHDYKKMLTFFNVQNESKMVK